MEQEEGGSGFLSTHSTEQCKSLIIVASYGHKHETTSVAFKGSAVVDSDKSINHELRSVG